MSHDGDDANRIKRRDLLASATLALPAAMAPRVLSAQSGRRAAPGRIRVGIIGAGGIVGSTHIPG